jgi:uncharacterized protein YllA (UPF0747 family)
MIFFKRKKEKEAVEGINTLIQHLRDLNDKMQQEVIKAQDEQIKLLKENNELQRKQMELIAKRKKMQNKKNTLKSKKGKNEKVHNNNGNNISY